MKAIVAFVIMGAAWFVYFQFIDWLFMRIQGLEYFKFIGSVFG